MIIFITISLLIGFSQVYSEDEPFWIYLDNPDVGIVRDIAFDNIGNYYISCENGIFKSDLNSPWEHILRGAITQLIIDSDNNIFATYSMTSYFPNRILRSKDLGKTWDTLDNIFHWLSPEQLEYKSKFQLFDLKLDINDIIYFTMHNDYEDDYRIMYSSDNGNSWNSCERIFNNPNEIRLSGVYKNGILAATIIDYDDENNLDSRKYGLSYDNGKTWEYIKIEGEGSLPFKEVDFINDSSMFLTLGSNLFFSQDSGKTVEKVVDPLVSVIDSYFYSKDVFLISSRNGIYKTEDFGKSWNYMTKDSIFLGDIKIDDNGRLLTSYRWGFIYSDDEGETFEKFNDGFHNFGVSQFALDQNGDIHFGLNGIYKYVDNGKELLRTNIDNLGFQRIMTLLDGTILATTNKLPVVVYISNDDGNTWIEYPEYPPFRDQVQTKNGYIFQIHGGCWSVSRSWDNGLTWEHNLNGSKGGEAIAINNKDEIFSACGFIGNGIWRSQNYGYSWYKVYEFNSSNWPSWVDNIFFDPDTLIGIAQGLSNFYKTTDNGETWRKFNPRDSGFENHSTQTVKDSSGNYWCGPNRSKDYGLTWEYINSGIPNELRRTYAMIVDPDGYIYLSMEYAGVFRSRDPIVSVEKIYPQNNALSIIPNPVSVSSKLNYTIDSDGFISISIYDALGNEVIQLLEEYQAQGTYSKEFQVKNLPSGIYFCKMLISNEIITKQFVVLK